MSISDKVSIIIPCYNNATTVLQTINSVELQTYDNLEIIVVDDGSTDNSFSTVQNYCKFSTKIKLLKQENKGPSAARNFGASVATGFFLLFLDADDLIDKTYIFKCVQILNEQKNINIVYCKANYFGAINSSWDLPEFNIDLFLVDNCIFITALIKKSVFDQVYGFDENLAFGEDWELWIKIIKQFGGVFRINETLFFYRKREDKSSITDNVEILSIVEKSTLHIYAKHYEFYKNNNFDIRSILYLKDRAEHYKKKYYNIWYKKIFYKLMNKKKY